MSEEDILKLEEKFNVKLPALYKAFLSTYFHMFEELDGVLDDFHCEDGKEVYVDIIGDFNGWGPLCFDIHNNYKLVWLDHEEYYSCETREELEELGETINTKPPESGIYGDDQEIYVYLNKVDEMPELMWQGVPQLFKE
ncbi:SMI1/KNR4 family protein [Clostridium coskatii]|nr:SMI1/KNR4 family protein [Clostridium coskatii]